MLWMWMLTGVAQAEGTVPSVARAEARVEDARAARRAARRSYVGPNWDFLAAIADDRDQVLADQAAAKAAWKASRSEVRDAKATLRAARKAV